MTQEELIEGCRCGDRDAQRALYEAHVDALFPVAQRLTGNAADAADCVQDVFVQALTHMDTFSGKSTLATWLYRITVNQALQLLRQRKRTAAKLRVLPVSASVPPADDAVDTQLDVEGALAAVSDEDRAIVILRYQQGLPYAEIAEVLDLPAGTVASRLNRARARLRVLLGDDG